MRYSFPKAVPDGDDVSGAYEGPSTSRKVLTARVIVESGYEGKLLRRNCVTIRN